MEPLWLTTENKWYSFSKELIKSDSSVCSWINRKGDMFKVIGNSMNVSIFEAPFLCSNLYRNKDHHMLDSSGSSSSIAYLQM